LAPGLKDLASRGARVIVLSHFGRPKGKRGPEFSLRPVGEALEKLVGLPVVFGADCVGPEAQKTVEAIEPGQIAVLENLRFHQGEEKNDLSFARQLAALGDLYVNDAFSCAHRAHASTEAITHLLPSYAGPLMMEEINALRSVLDKPRRPTAAIVGGAKISTKIPVLMNLVARVDKLIIGGGMANTFLQAQGIDVGKSLAEADFNTSAREIMSAARAKGCEIALPSDVVVAKEYRAGADNFVCDARATPADAMILDVGPQSVTTFITVIKGCKTLLWNGPVGAFEVEPFGAGTFALAREVAAMTKAQALVSVAGGGDTVAALNDAGVTSQLTYVSTAGGAFLEWLEGRELPGVAALADGR
jgi:phosphoglycerate kinase